jgi:hypothetical protein
MFKTIYPTADAVIYSQFPEKNTGGDQVLDLLKSATGEPSIVGDDSVFYSTTYNSRILLKFDLNELQPTQSNAEYFLTLRNTDALNLPTEFTIYAYPVSGSWTVGRGFVNSNPNIVDGVSWKYRHGKNDGRMWETSSLAANVTASYGTVAHGGTWFTSSFASQSFNYQIPDIRMNVTSIVRQWLSGSIPNNGFIIKYSDNDEFDTSQRTLIQWVSQNSHTIYLPRLEAYWNDQDLSGTGSFSEIGSDDYVLNCSNLRESYSTNEKPKIKVSVRDKFPTQTYATSSVYLNQKRLPNNSYFQIQDVVTDEVIIPFHPSGTLMSCDSNGNYFKADMSSLMPERFYKFVFKSNHENGDVIRVIDDNYIFKIKRV